MQGSGVPVALRSDQPNRRTTGAVIRAFLRWLKSWFRAETVAAPQCGEYSSHCASEPPQCAGSPGTVRAQCAETDAQCAATPVQRATEAFEVVKQAWRRAVEAPQHGEPRWSVNAKDLALTFRRCLQAQPDLIGWTIPKQWVQEAYPLLCEAEGVGWPPPYKDFAKELKWLMPRRRDFKQRPTCTRYLVPDPAAAVVELAAAERKRA